MPSRILAALRRPKRIATSLPELRYLVFEGMKGDDGDSAYEEAVKLGFEGTEEEWLASLKGAKGERGPAAIVPAYIDADVIRYTHDYGTHAADDIYTSLLMRADIGDGILPFLLRGVESDSAEEYFELDRQDLSAASPVVYFRSKEHLLAVDSTGAYTLTDRPQGGGSSDAVLYTPQTLTSAQQAQARENIGAGTYSKPSGGIPATDLAAGVIPDISGKANAADVYTKTEIDQKLVGAMDYKGTKATVSALPTSGNETGDVWHITADGSEWAWNGSAWEELGSAVDLSGYRTASAQDAIDAAQNTAIAAKYTKPSGGIPDSDIASAAVWNTKGTYSKPSGGIPKSDLASAVQTSLGKADTALQQHQSLTGYATETWVQNRGYQTAAEVQTAIAAKYTKPSTGIPKTDLASDVKASLGKADTALQEHQSLASYRTASAQDEIDNTQNVEIRKKANSTDLAAVATSGSYNDLTDKPSIPSLAGYATEAWVNNKGYLTLADLPVYNGGVT